ncbi:hypothetical protein MRX96_038138 [Rhipicephalus microplus]
MVAGVVHRQTRSTAESCGARSSISGDRGRPPFCVSTRHGGKAAVAGITQRRRGGPASRAHKRPGYARSRKGVDSRPRKTRGLSHAHTHRLART